MSLLSDSGDSFTTGVCAYINRPATLGESLNRLFVRVLVDDEPTFAVLDTGGAFLVLDPAFAQDLGLRGEESLGTTHLAIRGAVVRGQLHRVRLTIPADVGDDASVDVTAFVPIHLGEGVWSLPTFLGWHCCLERLRFAIDPAHEQFYFGPLE